MIKLDDNLLQELGLGALPPEEKKKMLAHIYETLEMRVGMELAKQMTDAQLKEFEQFIERNDEAGALQWLEANFPNYKQVVSAEFDKLKLEIKQVAPQIVASSQQQAQMHANAAALPPYPPAPAQQFAPGGYPQTAPIPSQQPVPPQPGQFPGQGAFPPTAAPAPSDLGQAGQGHFGAQGGQQVQPYPPAQPHMPPHSGVGPSQPYSPPSQPQQPYTPQQPPYPPAAA